MPETAAQAVVLSLLRTLAEDERRRIDEINRAWNAYNGEHPPAFEIRPGKPDDNVTNNLCETIVDKGIAWLFGQDPDVRVISEITNESGQEGESSPLQDALDLFWTVNPRQALLQKAALNGAVAGHSFLRLFQTGVSEPPRLIVLDPANVFPEWSADDYEDVHRYRLEWVAIVQGRPVVYRTLFERNEQKTAWTIQDQVSNSEGGDFENVGATQSWPWSFGPIVHCQNLPVSNQFWGKSDLTADVRDLNYKIEAAMSNAGKMVRLFAHPRPWAKGVALPDPRDPTSAVDPFDVAPDVTALLPPNAEVGALEFSADLPAAMEYLRELKEAFHERTRVPEIATRKTENIGQLSGLALKILYGPLIEKTEVKRGTYGPGLIIESSRRALAMMNKAPYEAIDCDIPWGEMLPSDPLTERQVAVFDDQLGVSKRTIQERLGYDPDVEAERKADEPSAVGEAALDAFDRG